MKKEDSFMNNKITFDKIETIKITVYKNSDFHCPIFTVESNNQATNVSEIIQDTLSMY